MPIVLLIAGWRLYFWANENNEPVHIHAEKGEMECKFWLDVENFEIKSALEYNILRKHGEKLKRLFMNILTILFRSGIFSSKNKRDGKSL